MRLEGWHIIVILALAAVAGVVILVLVTAAAARARAGSGAQGRGPAADRDRVVPGKEERLSELDDLLGRGVIGEEEHRESRRRILES